jgi:ABC-type spermidine/putrescine transport system permease subunit I
VGDARSRLGLLALPGAALLVAAFFVPLAGLISLSVYDKNGWTLKHFERLWEAPAYLRVLQRTLMMGAGTAALCLILGYPLAYRIATASDRAKALLIAGVLIPFWTNLLVRTYGWMVMLNPKGIINRALELLGYTGAPLALVNNTAGVYIGMTQIMLPYMVLPIAAVMVRLDPGLMRAARILGAGPVNAFLRVYLPLTLPGVMAGVLLVFTISLGFFVIPALLGGTRDIMLAQLVEVSINQTLNWGLAASLSTLLVTTTLLLYAVAYRRFRVDALWGALR